MAALSGEDALRKLMFAAVVAVLLALALGACSSKTSSLSRSEAARRLLASAQSPEERSLGDCLITRMYAAKDLSDADIRAVVSATSTASLSPRLATRMQQLASSCASAVAGRPPTVPGPAPSGTS